METFYWTRYLVLTVGEVIEEHLWEEKCLRVSAAAAYPAPKHSRIEKEKESMMVKRWVAPPTLLTDSSGRG